MRVRGRGKLIISLIIFLVMLTLSTSVVNADRGDGKIKGKTVGSTVVVSGEQNKEKDVFCVQHGTIIDQDTTYSVSGEYTVQDPVLAYILANGSLDTSNDPLGWRDETQVALWMYLYESGKNDDKDRIKSGIEGTIKNAEPSLPNYSNAQKLLADAKKYANNTKKLPTQYDVDIKIENATLNAEKGLVEFQVTAKNCDGFVVSYKKNTASTYTEYKNYLGSGTYDIEIPISKFNKGTYDFKVEAYRNIYEVKYKILKASGHQRLILVTNVAGEKKRVNTDEYVLESGRFDDLSLQKYIISVNGSTVSGRENKRTSEKETNPARVKDNISTSKTVNNTSYYKDANAVGIEKNDKVTYRIEVYNNDTRSVNAIIKDKLPDSCDLYGVKDHKGSYVTSSFKNESGTTYRYEMGTIAAGSSKYIDVIVTFKEGASTKINTAWISSEILNTSQYRTADRDYVRYKTPERPDDPEDPEVPKKYAVALRKTVSAVNGKSVLRDKIVDDADKYDVNEDGVVNRRDPLAILKKVAGLDVGDTLNEGKAKVLAPSYTTLTASDARIILQQIIRENYPLYGGNDYKEQNPISVEVGDTVTYAISLINTGNQDIIVKQITDTFDNSYLEYINGSIRGYGNPTVTKSRWNFNN